MIDSNILIFVVSDPDELTREVKDILDDHSNLIYISSRCVEELMHLQQSGRLNVKMWKSAEDIIHTIVDDFDFGIKHTGNEHLFTLARLPLLPDHRDPTDRIAIAQAITEKMPIISSDREFQRYRRYGLELVFNKR
jgi:PIN domain nuclease of toxin-antitoxin system